MARGPLRHEDDEEEQDRPEIFELLQRTLAVFAFVSPLELQIHLCVGLPGTRPGRKLLVADYLMPDISSGRSEVYGRGGEKRWRWKARAKRIVLSFCSVSMSGS